MILLRIFFVFEGLWRKFFGALEAWIRRASPICGLLRFLEAFELDSNDLWDLGRWFGWFLFECSLYLKLKFLKFLEASRLDSCKVFVLMNPSGLLLALLQLQPLLSLFLASLKCLRKASIYRSLGVGERHVAECNSWHMSQPDWSAYVIVYTCEATCVIAYTCEAACVIAYTCWGVIGSCMTLGKFLLVSE